MCNNNVLLSADLNFQSLQHLWPVMSYQVFFFFFKSAAKDKLPGVTSLTDKYADVAHLIPQRAGQQQFSTLSDSLLASLRVQYHTAQKKIRLCCHLLVKNTACQV